MMNTKLITLSVIASASFACMGIAPAVAQNTPAVDDAQQRVHARIVQGARSGHITRREADQLLAKERQIVRQERRFKADGRITIAERRTLRNQIALLSSEVERKISNRRMR